MDVGLILGDAEYKVAELLAPIALQAERFYASVPQVARRYPAVLRRGDARSSAAGARRLSPSPPLVIDDMHELVTDGAQAHVNRLLAELPESVHAVLGTRRDLQLRLHQLRLAAR